MRGPWTIPAIPPSRPGRPRSRAFLRPLAAAPPGTIVPPPRGNPSLQGTRPPRAGNAAAARGPPPPPGRCWLRRPGRRRIALGALAVLALLAVAGGVLAFAWTRELPAFDGLKDYRPLVSTRVSPPTAARPSPSPASGARSSPSTRSPT